VVHIVDRAAAAAAAVGAELGQPPLVPELHGEPDNIVPLPGEKSGDGRAVHPTAHGHGDRIVKHGRGSGEKSCADAPPNRPRRLSGSPPAPLYWRGRGKTGCWPARAPSP